MNAIELPPGLRALLPAAPSALVCPATAGDRTVIDVATIFPGQRIVDAAAAQACVAGLLLARDRFHDSHAVSQDLATAEGSYWHGILHRREPDAVNAKYWMRQVGRHPVHGPLAAATRQLAGERFLERGAWNAARFVDACTAGGEGDLEAGILMAIQAKEVELLLAWCAAQAVGSG